MTTSLEGQCDSQDPCTPLTLDSARSNDSIVTGGCAYSNGTVCFTDREAHAKRAYHEWIPIRAVDISDESRIWRQFNFGDLLDVFALDTRKYDRDVTDSQ